MWVQLTLILIALPLLQGYGLDDHFTPVCIAFPVVIRLVRRRLIAPAAVGALIGAWALVIVHDQVVYHLARTLPSLTWMRQPQMLAVSSLLLYAMVLALVALGFGTRSTTPARVAAV